MVESLMPFNEGLQTFCSKMHHLSTLLMPDHNYKKLIFQEKVEMHIRPSHQLDHDWLTSLDSVTAEKSRVIATFDLSEARSVSKVRLIAHGRYRKFSLFVHQDSEAEGRRFLKTRFAH